MRPPGTLERVVIIRTEDYWASVEATLTDDLRPSHPRVHVLHAISSAQFAEVFERIDRFSLYYPHGWHLDVGAEPVLHDDMIVADDIDAVPDEALVALADAHLAAACIEVVDRLDETTLGPSTLEADTAAVTDRSWLSLGGWCGPAIGMRRLVGKGVRYAFDYLLSSLPGVDQVLLGDGEGYVPPRPFPLIDVEFNRPDDIAARNIIGPEQWRMPEFIHSHERFDIDEDVWDHLAARAERTRQRLLTHEGPIFLMRAITGPDWHAERDGLVDVRRRLVEANPACDPRLIVVVHSQHCGTVRLAPIAPGIDTWAAQGAFGSLDDTGLPFVRYEAEYARIFLRVAHDDARLGAGAGGSGAPNGSARAWPPPPDLPVHEIHDHNEHWIF